MPRGIRRCVAPLIGSTAACACICCLAIPVIIMAAFYGEDENTSEVESFFTLFLLSKLYSLLAAVFPFGLALYSFKRCREKEPYGYGEAEVQMHGHVGSETTAKQPSAVPSNSNPGVSPGTVLHVYAETTPHVNNAV